MVNKITSQDDVFDQLCDLLRKDTMKYQQSKTIKNNPTNNGANTRNNSNRNNIQNNINKTPTQKDHVQRIYSNIPDDMSLNNIKTSDQSPDKPITSSTNILNDCKNNQQTQISNPTHTIPHQTISSISVDSNQKSFFDIKRNDLFNTPLIKNFKNLSTDSHQVSNQNQKGSEARVYLDNCKSLGDGNLILENTEINKFLGKSLFNMQREYVVEFVSKINNLIDQNEIDYAVSQLASIKDILIRSFETCTRKTVGDFVELICRLIDYIYLSKEKTCFNTIKSYLDDEKLINHIEKYYLSITSIKEIEFVIKLIAYSKEINALLSQKNIIKDIDKEISYLNIYYNFYVNENSQFQTSNQLEILDTYHYYKTNCRNEYEKDLLKLGLSKKEEVSELKLFKNVTNNNISNSQIISNESLLNNKVSDYRYFEKCYNTYKILFETNINLALDNLKQTIDLLNLQHTEELLYIFNYIMTKSKNSLGHLNLCYLNICDVLLEGDEQIVNYKTKVLSKSKEINNGTTILMVHKDSFKNNLENTKQYILAKMVSDNITTKSNENANNIPVFEMNENGFYVHECLIQTNHEFFGKSFLYNEYLAIDIDIDNDYITNLLNYLSHDLNKNVEEQDIKSETKGYSVQNDILEYLTKNLGRNTSNPRKSTMALYFRESFVSLELLLNINTILKPEDYDKYTYYPLNQKLPNYGKIKHMLKNNTESSKNVYKCIKHIMDNKIALINTRGNSYNLNGDVLNIIENVLALIISSMKSKQKIEPIVLVCHHEETLYNILLKIKESYPKRFIFIDNSENRPPLIPDLKNMRADSACFNKWTIKTTMDWNNNKEKAEKLQYELKRFYEYKIQLHNIFQKDRVAIVHLFINSFTSKMKLLFVEIILRSKTLLFESYKKQNNNNNNDANEKLLFGVVYNWLFGNNSSNIIEELEHINKVNDESHATNRNSIPNYSLYELINNAVPKPIIQMAFNDFDINMNKAQKDKLILKFKEAIENFIDHNLMVLMKKSVELKKKSKEIIQILYHKAFIDSNIIVITYLGLMKYFKLINELIDSAVVIFLEANICSESLLLNYIVKSKKLKHLISFSDENNRINRNIFNSAITNKLFQNSLNNRILSMKNNTAIYQYDLKLESSRSPTSFFVDYILDFFNCKTSSIESQLQNIPSLIENNIKGVETDFAFVNTQNKHSATEPTSDKDRIYNTCLFITRFCLYLLNQGYTSKDFVVCVYSRNIKNILDNIIKQELKATFPFKYHIDKDSKIENLKNIQNCESLDLHLNEEVKNTQISSLYETDLQNFIKFSPVELFSNQRTSKKKITLSYIEFDDLQNRENINELDLYNIYIDYIMYSASLGEEALYVFMDFEKAIGSKNHIGSSSVNPLKTFIKNLENLNLASSKIPLKCSNHTDQKHKAEISDTQNPFLNICKVKCETLLECGHMCEQEYCHSYSHDLLKCQKQCTRSNRKKHRCKHKCLEKCSTCSQTKNCPPCLMKTTVTNLKCNHEITTLCCNKNEAVKNTYCKVLVDIKIPKCGHYNQVFCYQKQKVYRNTLKITCTHKKSLIYPCGHTNTVICNDFLPCSNPCEKEFQCGHKCQKNCGQEYLYKNALNNKPLTILNLFSELPFYEETNLEGKIQDKEELNIENETSLEENENLSNIELNYDHDFNEVKNEQVKSPHSHEREECSMQCSTNLICRHKCQNKCGQFSKHTQFCFLECNIKCFHNYKCPRKCYNICVDCAEPCKNNCQHFNCNKKCSQICSRKRCESRCIKKLDCGHECVGYCGEECPPCYKCNPEIVCAISLLKIGYLNIEKSEKLYILPECKCVFYADYLDKYFSSDLTVDGHTPINMWDCPKCRAPTFTALRYQREIKTKLRLINKVKTEMLKKLKQVSEKEKNMVVEAMQSEIDLNHYNSAKGRWFICPNKHPYFIGDCGGATQISKCLECNETVGGSEHKIVSTNKFYGELDHSLEPAWPNQE